jgi:hypothetical protein
MLLQSKEHPGVVMANDQWPVANENTVLSFHCPLATGNWPLILVFIVHWQLATGH